MLLAKPYFNTWELDFQLLFSRYSGVCFSKELKSNVLEIHIYRKAQKFSIVFMFDETFV